MTRSASNVRRLRPPEVPPKPARRVSLARINRQRVAAAGAAAVAVVLTGLSLSHLSHGIHLVTQAPPAESWAMATGVDLGFIASELAMLCASTEAVRRSVARFAQPAIAGTLGMSAALNALAFALPMDGWQLYAAAALGVAIPALVYALARVAFALATQGPREA
ncbi:hypothetical protein [Azorhizobium doebereinerae]|uniref:hypothetical protein n=1 Tax=Azorhizobium doebereinerae TaxID=281091 RepID=UPI00048C9B98|nr:hypothetical protein [Azorhizobium doebereinerae]